MTDFRLKVAAVCCHNYARMDKVKAVTAILKHHDFDYTLTVDPLWTGWSSKLLGFIDIVKNLPDEYTHLMFLDAADIVLLAGQDEVMERYFEFNHPWVYNAEPFIWSEGSFQPKDYPTPDVLYRYLNSGASIGEIEHLRHWFSRWPRPKALPHGDQDWMAARFLEDWPNAIKLDTNCDLFQCMCGSQAEPDPYVRVGIGKVYNRITSTNPLIVHFNGGTDITAPDRRFLWGHFLQKPLPG